MESMESRLGALAFRDFRFFLATRLPSNLGVQIQSVAIGWQVYDLTHKPLDLGFVGLAQFLPVFGFALIAGHVADRFDRRRILALCFSIQILCSALLVGFVMSGSRVIWPIYGILVLFGAARSFSAPAIQSLLPNLVPTRLLGSAFAWNSAGFQSMTIAGPAVGGFVYALGPAVVYASSAVLSLVAALSVLAIRPAAAREKRAADWESLLAGIRFIRRRRDIFGAISLDLFAVLFGGATALLPVYARDILDVGPQGLGLLRSAPAAGAVAVGLILARRSLGARAGRTMFLGVVMFGVATIVFGLSHNVILSLAALFVLGAADMLSVFVRQNLVQRATPDAMRGRVSAVTFLFVGASNELGEMESGLTAAWFGTVTAVVVGGGATLVVAAAWRRFFPELFAIDRLENIASD
jgi:MFS family permease